MRSPLIEAACAFQLSLDAAGRSGAENMAIDAALLDRANGTGLSVLRLYRFDPPCLSLGRRLVAAQRQTRRVEAVEPQEAQARAVGAVEQRRVDRHVLGAGAARSVEGELASACRLNQRRAHRPPSAGTRTPGSDRRTRRPRGSPTAIPCATASTPRGRRRARAYTADPTCRR